MVPFPTLRYRHLLVILSRWSLLPVNIAHMSDWKFFFFFSFISVSLAQNSKDSLLCVTAFSLRAKQNNQPVKIIRLTPLPSLLHRLLSALLRVGFSTGHGSVLRRCMTSCWAAGRGNRSSDWTLRTFRRSCLPWVKPRRSTWTSSASAAWDWLFCVQTDRHTRIQE